MDRIRPYEKNPFYWEYKGAPVLLLGGSVEDNLFQIPDIEEHLDLLKSVGGNYVRCTMSSRDEGNVWPFERDEKTGRYDLDKPSAEFWSRFERFLKLTHERDIIVQIELWATFDFYRDNWAANPFNPASNINYSGPESKLPEQVPTHPTRCENPFFWSVPREHNNEIVLKHQRAFVDRLLLLSLPYAHVLYCMDNETSVTPEWGWYWSKYIKAAGERAGAEVHTTEMWDKWDLSHEQHDATFDHPEIYSFVDISQNNHRQGQVHWDNAQWARRRIVDSGKIRPMNCVKIYGADTGRFGNARDGQERFWRNVFGGMAAARFHRPNSGLGLGEIAQANIKSMRMLTDELNVFASRPANELLAEEMRSPNEAYCIADPPRAYAVYFTDRGNVLLDVSAVGDKPLTIRWLDIAEARWEDPVRIVPSESALNLKFPSSVPECYGFTEEGKMSLAPPGGGMWAVLVKTEK